MHAIHAVHNKMTQVNYEETLYDYRDAILNEEFEGFKEDYLVLHSLLRRYRPASYLEIGTNMGTGINIACNAIYQYHFEAQIYSLDLPTELAHISLQHPISEGKGDKVGLNCKLPYKQLRGDSMTFDFSKYPVECYYVDSEHNFKTVFKETMEILKQEPLLVIYHDTDIPEVFSAIIAAFKGHINGNNYELYRVLNTRITYARRK